MTRLVENLLDLSRIQSGEVEPHAELCSAEELIGAALESVGAPSSALEIVVNPDLPPIEADGAQLERALANVIENSVRYAGATSVTIRAEAVGRQLVITVSDRGPRIAETERERIFEPFYRGQNQSRGSGPGLAIARGFAEANGGALRLRSAADDGTTFAFHFPAVRQPAATTSG